MQDPILPAPASFSVVPDHVPGQDRGVYLEFLSLGECGEEVQLAVLGSGEEGAGREQGEAREDSGRGQGEARILLQQQRTVVYQVREPTGGWLTLFRDGGGGQAGNTQQSHCVLDTLYSVHSKLHTAHSYCSLYTLICTL